MMGCNELLKTCDTSSDVQGLTWRSLGDRWANSVLVVGDDDVIGQSLLDWLDSVLFDSRVIGANGHEVIGGAIAESPDVVVVDVALSAYGGVDTVRETRKSFPNARIVALTDDGDLETRDALLAAGADLCLQLWHVHETLEPALRRVLQDA